VKIISHAFMEGDIAGLLDATCGPEIFPTEFDPNL
jgi:hypothetical protein